MMRMKTGMEENGWGRRDDKASTGLGQVRHWARQEWQA